MLMTFLNVGDGIELIFFSEKVTHGLSLTCAQLETGDSRDMSDILEAEAILKKVRLNKNHHNYVNVLY